MTAALGSPISQEGVSAHGRTKAWHTCVCVFSAACQDL